MKERTLNRMFLNRIEEGGDAVRFLVPGEGAWKPMTYREVGAAVRELAHGLMGLGLAKGDKVAILSSTRVEWALADIAVILGGFVAVPIYPSNLPDQVEFILAHSEARAVFVEDAMQWNKVAGSRKKLPALSAMVLMTGDPAGMDGTVGLADLRKSGAVHAAAHPGAIDLLAGRSGRTTT